MQNSEEKLGFAINTAEDRNYHGDEIVEIAKIINEDTSEDVLYVRYYKETYSKMHYHIAAGFCNENGIPVVYIDDEHKDCLYDKPELFFALMLHELGHYRNKDTEVDEEPNLNQKNMNDRTRDILAGKVQEKELKADAFAVKHIGKNKMLRAMDYMIQKRKERVYDPGREIAIKEIELRKKAVQKLKF